MINAEDGIIVDLNTSCTIEVAVAKLLGWMRGPIYRKIIKINEHGISEDQLPYLQSMEGSLEEQLSELSEAARQQFLDAFEADMSTEEKEKREEAAKDIDSLIRKAHTYTLNIDEELSKGEDSAIKIDLEKTEQTGITHITLVSIDKWARDTYHISIVENLEPDLSSEGVQAQTPVPETEEDLDTEKGLSRTIADNLFTTLALLVEALAETANNKYGEDEPNVMAIARRIHHLAAKTNGGERMAAQSISAIQKRINKAKKVKESRTSSRVIN